MTNKTTLVKVPTLKGGNDKEAAAQLKAFFAEAQNGMRRVVALGMFCYHLKEQLKHGQFQPWLAAACPDISYRSLASYMRLTRSVLEACGIKTIAAFSKKLRALHFSNGSEILLLPDADVPAEAKPLREKICSLIDGKSARQLFLEFKQTDEDEDKPKRGRLKGHGGASKEQRAKAAALEAQAQITADELDAVDFAKWIDKVADLSRLPMIDDKVWRQFSERVEYLHTFIRQVNESRASARQAAKGGA
jgi:hypothetical protein